MTRRIRKFNQAKRILNTTRRRITKKRHLKSVTHRRIKQTHLRLEGSIIYPE